MPSLEDLQEWVKNRSSSPEKSIERSIVKGVAVAMSELKGDPNWKLFCDHIEPLRLQAKAQVERIEHDLIYGPIMADHSHYEAKRQLAIAKTRFDTYNQVIQVIDNLINRGSNLTAA